MSIADPSTTSRESAEHPTEGTSDMTPILILKAFGHLPSTDLIESERERERREWMDSSTGVEEVGTLLRAFEARANVMGWGVASPRDATLPQPLWNVFEAGLFDGEDDPSLIGWAYVGVVNPIDLSRQPLVPRPGTGAGWAATWMPPGYGEFTVALPVALPPFVQCLDDAVRRIGATDVSGYQLTCHHANLQPSQRSREHLVSGIGWFHVPAPDAIAVDALVAFDRGFLGDHPTSELRSRVGRRGNEPFEFDLAPDLPDEHRVRVPGSSIIQSVAFEPSEIGLSVRMPEWSATAAGWVLATVVDAAHTIAPDVENFVLRITRVR